MSTRLPVFAGLVGDVVDTFDPHTEASRIAVAGQFLVGFGNAVGRGAFFRVGETLHYPNEFLALVGRTGRSRKGDSKEVALATLREADPAWASNIASGLSSGEGLIYSVRDPVLRVNQKGELVLGDEGVSDKRLLVVESEFSSVLKQFARDGNTLSNVLRDGWDGKDVLRTLTKTSPTRATGAHLSLIAHTTPEDLARYLGDTEAANGLGNRFAFILCERSKQLPDPSRVSAADREKLVKAVRTALDAARSVGELTRTPGASELWRGIYPELTRDEPGLIGSVLARAEAHVVRFSQIYALLAQTRVVDVGHLESALAFWDITSTSARVIFANRTGNDLADRIRTEMLPGQSMTLREIRQQYFANHVSAGRLASGSSFWCSSAKSASRPASPAGDRQWS